MPSDADLGAGRTCFVIGPIGSRLDPRGTDGRLRYEEATQMWENVFEPACEQFSLSPIRADRIAAAGEIPEQIFLHLRDSDLVIADVTGGNANVMYELGLRHTRDRMTIQLGEYQRLPFDINTIRTIQFRRSEGGLIEARDELIAAIRAALTGAGTAVTATRLWNQLATADSAAVAQAVHLSLAAVGAEEESAEEPGFMDLLADGEAALEEVSGFLTTAAEAMSEVGALSESAGARIAESDARGGGFGGRLIIARQLAEDLRPQADVLDTAAREFAVRAETMDAMMQYMFSRWGEDPSEVEESIGFGHAMLSMIEAAAESEVGMESLITGSRSLKRISRDLAPVGKSMEVSVNKMLTATHVIIAWRDQLRSLFGDPPPPAVP